MLRIAYAIEDDRYPGLRDYYYELPQDIEKALSEDVELVAVPDLYNNDWTRALIPIYNGAEVRGEGCAEEDWYFEKIARRPAGRLRSSTGRCGRPCRLSPASFDNLPTPKTCRGGR